MEISLNKWYEDLIWCPSQCYYYFMDGKVLKCIYLRWRWDNPWTVDLVTFRNSDNNNPNWDTAKWEYVDLGYYRAMEYKELQKKAVRRLVRLGFIYKIKKQWQRRSNASTR